jgi:NAD/NADP transhydrogenase alpha subunit
VPGVVALLRKLGVDVVVRARAPAESAGFTDAMYAEQQAAMGTRAEAFDADIVAQVRSAGCESRAWRCRRRDAAALRSAAHRLRRSA